MELELLPVTNEDRQVAMLAFAGVVGGGVIAYEAARSIREGDLFKMDEVKERPQVGIVSLGIGLGLLGMTMEEAAKEVGWKPLIYGSLALTGVVGIIRLVRR